MKFQALTISSFVLLERALALDGGRLRIKPFNGWKAIKIITAGDSKGRSWRLPDNFDGAGAFAVDGDTIRIYINHEKGDSSITEVNVDKNKLKQAISNMIRDSEITLLVVGVSFVNSARLAYERWSSDGGVSFTTEVLPDDTKFCKFCSSQAHKPDTFGNNRGFVDQIYMTGEEC
jgi:hypothetical protein